jgi:hypothetical protein
MLQSSDGYQRLIIIMQSKRDIIQNDKSKDEQTTVYNFSEITDRKNSNDTDQATISGWGLPILFKYCHRKWQKQNNILPELTIFAYI